MKRNFKSLVQRTMSVETSPEMALARTEDMIRFFRSAPAEVIKLNVAVDFNIDMRPDDKVSVHTCGSAACVGGHVALRYLSPTCKVDRYGNLFDPQGMEMYPLDTAAKLLRKDLVQTGGLFSARNKSYMPERQEALERLERHAGGLKDYINARKSGKHASAGANA